MFGSSAQLGPVLLIFVYDGLVMFGRLLREKVLSIACQMGDQDALNEASRIFDEWISGSGRLAFLLSVL